MRIAIYGRPFNKNLLPFIEPLLDELKKGGVEWTMHEAFLNYLQPKLNFSGEQQTFSKYNELKDNVDFLFSIGGDGTLLDTLALVRNSDIPIMGINIGRLGFLASVPKENFGKALEALKNGHFSLDKRSLLKLETNKGLFGDVNYALNELTIHKKDTSSMMTIHAYLNGEYLNSYWADGLIISTPTGSTGYSLSCGGPILVPQSESFVITPIAPHNLNVRPVIVSDKNVISLEMEGRSQHFLASLDSRSATIDSNTQLAVRKEDFYVNLVRLNTETFSNTLRNKLMWGMDSRN